MIRKSILKAAAVLILFILMAGIAMAATQTLTGVVTDDMCPKNGVNKHTMAPGKPDAECVRGCVQAGAKYALFTDDKKLYILKGDAKQFDALAAQKVKVAGDVSGNTISVRSIAAAK
jgi:hypothetical protein